MTKVYRKFKLEEQLQPTVVIPDQIEINHIPFSLDSAVEERRKMVEIQQRIQVQLGENRDHSQWRRDAKRKLNHVTRRMSFLKDWIKEENVRIRALKAKEFYDADLKKDPELLIQELYLIARRLFSSECPPSPKEQTVIEAAQSFLREQKSKVE